MLSASIPNWDLKVLDYFTFQPKLNIRLKKKKTKTYNLSLYEMLYLVSSLLLHHLKCLEEASVQVFTEDGKEVKPPHIWCSPRSKEDVLLWETSLKECLVHFQRLVRQMETLEQG